MDLTDQIQFEFQHSCLRRELEVSSRSTPMCPERVLSTVIFNDSHDQLPHLPAPAKEAAVQCSDSPPEFSQTPPRAPEETHLRRRSVAAPVKAVTPLKVPVKQSPSGGSRASRSFTRESSLRQRPSNRGKHFDLHAIPNVNSEVIKLLKLVRQHARGCCKLKEALTANDGPLLFKEYLRVLNS